MPIKLEFQKAIIEKIDPSLNFSDEDEDYIEGCFEACVHRLVWQKEVDVSKPSDFAQAKRIIKWNGLEIGVEYFPGDRRHNKILKSGYGHIRNTIGADKMALDIYFHSDVPNPDVQTSDKLYKITQLDSEGNFDEHKYMVGFKSKNEARQAYLKQMPKAMFGGIKKVAIASLEEYRKPIRTDSDRFVEQSVDAALPEVGKWRSQINDEIQRINNLDIGDRSKFNQLESELFRLYEEMDGDDYAEILGSAISAAELNGRYDVSKSSK